MDLLPLPIDTENALQARRVSARTITAIRLVTTCLQQACEWVSQDTGSDRKDDATSRGGLRWRRTRNFVIEVLEEGVIPDLRGIHADLTDNALQVPVDGTRLSFYAARDGIDYPDLGGSTVKKLVVSEMQTQIPGLEVDVAPSRLVLMYEADRDGLVSADIGRLSSSRAWAEEWRFDVFKREEEDLSTIDRDLEPPAYEEQPEPELPPLMPIPQSTESRDSGIASDN